MRHASVSTTDQDPRTYPGGWIIGQMKLMMSSTLFGLIPRDAANLPDVMVISIHWKTEENKF